MEKLTQSLTKFVVDVGKQGVDQIDADVVQSSQTTWRRGRMRKQRSGGTSFYLSQTYLVSFSPLYSFIICIKLTKNTQVNGAGNGNASIRLTCFSIYSFRWVYVKANSLLESVLTYSKSFEETCSLELLFFCSLFIATQRVGGKLQFNSRFASPDWSHKVWFSWFTFTYKLTFIKRSLKWKLWLPPRCLR